jgi:hypothetical protein
MTQPSYSLAVDKPDDVLPLVMVLLLLLLFNCNWVDTRWQQYSTHLHTNSTQNTEDGAHITIKKKKLGSKEKNWEVRKKIFTPVFNNVQSQVILKNIPYVSYIINKTVDMIVQLSVCSQVTRANSGRKQCLQQS